MRPSACLLLVLCLLAPVAAQQPKRATALEGDARLDKPITVQAKKVTLFDLLRDVSRQTGVSLNPDRAVVDEPLMLSVTGMPAREVLKEVADLTHFTWIRNGGTQAKPTYLLFKDLAAVREEEAERNKAQRAVLESIQEELRRCRAFSRLSPEQAEKELERADREFETALRGAFTGGGGVGDLQSPRGMRKMMDGMTLRTAASPTGRVMIQVLDSLTPAQWEAVMAEESVVFSTRPGEGELPLSARFGDALRQSSPSFPLPKSLFRQLGPQAEEGINQIEGFMRDQWGRAEGFRVGVQLSLQVGSQPMGMLRVSPSPIAPAAGGMAGPGEEGMGAVFGMAGLNLIGAPILLEEGEDPVEREKRLSADPVLGRKAKLKLPAAPAPAVPGAPPGMAAFFGGGLRAPEALPLVETAFGVRIIGDAYNRQAMTFFPGSGEVELPLFKALDQLAGAGRGWELAGNTVRIKSKTWAHDRRCEIPMRYMKRWTEMRARKGGFTLDDLAEVASTLRDEQVDSLMFAAMELGNGAEDGAAIGELAMVSMNKDMLRFWGRLLPLQRRNLLAGQAIPARALYPQQQQALLALSRPKGNSMFALASGIRPARTPGQLAQAVLTMETTALGVGPNAPPAPTTPGGPGGLYTLRVTLPSGQKDEYRLMLPRAGAVNAPPAPPVAVPAQPEPPR